MAKGFSSRSKLSALYELETSICPCFAGSYTSYFLGGAFVKYSEYCKEEEVYRMALSTIRTSTIIGI